MVLRAAARHTTDADRSVGSPSDSSSSPSLSLTRTDSSGSGSGGSKPMLALAAFTRSMLETGHFSDVTLLVEGTCCACCSFCSVPCASVRDRALAAALSALTFFRAVACVADQKIRAHKGLLTRSAYFATMFSPQFSEGKQDTVEIKDVDAQVALCLCISCSPMHGVCLPLPRDCSHIAGLPSASGVHL